MTKLDASLFGLKKAADIEHAVATRPQVHLYAYAQGPSPRQGTRVLAKNRPGTLMAVSVSNHQLVLLDDGNRVRAEGALKVLGNEPRLTLHQVLQLAISNIRESLAASQAPAILFLDVLMLHFQGGNGARYMNREAECWLAYATALLGGYGTGSIGIFSWMIGEFSSGRAGSETGADPIAALMKSIEEAGSAQSPGMSPTIIDMVGDAFERALKVGDGAIRAAEDDCPQQVDLDSVARYIAHDPYSGQRSVLIGRARTVAGEDQVEQIMLDDNVAIVRSVVGLEISDDRVDHAWFWDLIVASVQVQSQHRLLPMAWLAETLTGPDGSEACVPERIRLAILAAVYCARASGQFYVVSSAPARWMKRARELLKLLDKGDRAKLQACAPELITAGKPAKFGHHDALEPHFFRALEETQQVLAPPPAESEQASEGGPPVGPEAWLEAHEPPRPASEADAPPVQLDTPVEGDAPPATPHPAPRARPAREQRQAYQRQRVAFARPAEQLRFKVTDHELQATEWLLVDAPDAHASAVTSTLVWIEERIGTSLPKRWRDGGHEIERNGVRLEIESGDGLFAFRLEHPDRDQPTRWWRLEASLIRGRGGVGGIVSLRLHARDLVDLPAPSLSVPGLVRGWAERPGLMLAGARSGTTMTVRTREEFEALAGIIDRTNRDTPVLVVPLGQNRLPPMAHHRALARIVQLAPEQADYLARFGAIAPDGAHLFGPRTHAVETVSLEGKAAQQQLLERICQLRLNRHIPRFRDVREMILGARADAAKQQAAEPAPAPETAAPVEEAPAIDLAALARREVEQVEELLELAETERDAARQEAAAASLELMEAQEELEAASVEIEALQLRLAHLQSVVDGRAAPVARAGAALPESLEALPGWATGIAPRVVLADKALRFAARQSHAEVGKIYATLQALHDHYWRSKWSSDERDREEGYTAWKAFQLGNRLSLTGVGIAKDHARYADEYTALVGQERFTATLHVAGNSARDPMRCLRIYIALDDDAQRVVVTHLPTHLTSTLT